MHDEMEIGHYERLVTHKMRHFFFWGGECIDRCSLEKNNANGSTDRLKDRFTGSINRT